MHIIVYPWMSEDNFPPSVIWGVTGIKLGKNILPTEPLHWPSQVLAIKVSQ